MKLVTTIIFCMLAVSMGQFTSIKEKIAPQMVSDSRLGINWEDTFNQFLIGANMTGIVKNSTDCVSHTGNMFGNMTEALSEYIRKPSINNFFGVTESLRYVTPVVEACFESAFEANVALARYIGKFNGNPVTWWKAFDANWKGNVLQLAALGTQFKTALFDNDDIPKASNLLGQIFKGLFDFEPVSRLAQLESFPDDFETFVEGFIAGTQVLNTTNIYMCTDTTRWYLDSWELAFKAFAKGTAEGVKEGWGYIAESFNKVHSLAFSCWHGTEDFFEILYKYFDLTQPWELIYKTGHGIDVLHQALIATMEEMAKSSTDFFKAGNLLGVAVHKVYIEAPAAFF